MQAAAERHVGSFCDVSRIDMKKACILQAFSV
jgi:hypothetical protein